VLLKDSLQLSVQDNGIGFIVDEADSGNGLNNMRKRTLQLGGEIHIQSKPGSGTTIQLKIPVH
jgi:signal transduction histidine kinase